MCGKAKLALGAEKYPLVPHALWADDVDDWLSHSRRQERARNDFRSRYEGTDQALLHRQYMTAQKQILDKFSHWKRLIGHGV